MRSFRHGVLAALEALREGGAHVRTRWRQSLKVRVVTTTMLLGLAVVSVLGGVLHSQIASGLERDRIDQSENEALNLTSKAQSLWDATTSTSVGELNHAADGFDLEARMQGIVPTTRGRSRLRTGRTAARLRPACS